MSFKPYIHISLICFACSCKSENAKPDSGPSENKRTLKELSTPNNYHVYQEVLDMVDTFNLQSLQGYLKREQYGSVPVIFDSLHSSNFEGVKYVKQGDKLIRVRPDSVGS